MNPCLSREVGWQSLQPHFAARTRDFCFEAEPLGWATKGVNNPSQDYMASKTDSFNLVMLCVKGVV